MAHLLKYDSVLGTLPYDIKATKTGITVDGDELKVLSERNPKDLPWGELGVDVVIESTGFFTTRDAAAAHLEAGAPLVIVSAPCDGADATFVYGVNHKDFDPKTEQVISNASCTTNCFVPVVKVLDDAFGVENGLMQTVHAYTGDQQLVDGPHKRPAPGPRRGDQHRAHVHRRGPGHEPRARVDEGQARRHVAARAGPDRFDRRLHRQPEDAGHGGADQRGVRQGGQERSAQGDPALHRGPDRVERHRRRPAQRDLRRRPHVSLGSLVKVLAWYDNEWGYSNRLVDITLFAGGKVAAQEEEVGDAASCPRLPDLGDVSGKRVLVRTDFNVPLDGGRITDDFRIRAALPTIEWLTERGAQVVTASHLGRPKGTADPKYSMDPVRERLAELAPGVELLENLRYDPGEEGNDPAFVAQLVDGHRRLRRRRVRRRAPRPRLDRRAAEDAAVGDGPAAGEGGRRPPRPAQQPEAAVRRRARRGQDQRQARRGRGVARHRRRAGDRRGDVLHVPRRAGLSDRRLPVGARPGRHLHAPARLRQDDPPARGHRRPRRQRRLLDVRPAPARRRQGLRHRPGHAPRRSAT